MDCRRFALQVDDWLDGRLTAAEGQRLQSHLDDCPGCRRGYRDSDGLRLELRRLAAPAMRPGYAERALAKAAAAPGWARRGRTGIALAASVLLGLAMAAILLAQRPDAVQTLVLTVRQPEDLHLVFNAGKPLPGATLSLSLPADVEIVGYGGRRELVWQTDLGQGGNLLRLPLVARGGAGGELVARLSRGSSSKIFRIRIEVKGAGAAGAEHLTLVSLAT